MGLVLATSVEAAPITFDPDGAGRANGDLAISALDWAPGNLLQVGFDDPSVTFATLYQARLASRIVEVPSRTIRHKLC